MARTDYPGGHIWRNWRFCALMKIAQIPAATSKFKGVWLEQLGPPWTIQIRYQFYIPRFLTIKLCGNFDFESSPQKFPFRNFCTFPLPHERIVPRESRKSKFGPLIFGDLKSSWKFLWTLMWGIQTSFINMIILYGRLGMHIFLFVVTLFSWPCLYLVGKQIFFPHFCNFWKWSPRASPKLFADQK